MQAVWKPCSGGTEPDFARTYMVSGGIMYVTDGVAARLPYFEFAAATADVHENLSFVCSTDRRIVRLCGCSQKPVFALDVNATQAKRLMFPPKMTAKCRAISIWGICSAIATFTTRSQWKAVRWICLVDFWNSSRVKRRRARSIGQQSGVVNAEGRILVADRGTASIFVFDKKAATMELWQQAEGSRKFVSPVGVAVGADGIVFVTDSELGLVARLDRKGNSIGPIGKGHLTRPTGIAYDATTRRIYVTDTGDHQVKVFDMERGRVARRLGRAWARGRGNSTFPPTSALRARSCLWPTR